MTDEKAATPTSFPTALNACPFPLLSSPAVTPLEPLIKSMLGAEVRQRAVPQRAAD